MTLRPRILFPAMLLLAGLAVAGCERDTSGLEPVPPDTDPVVFDDNFGAGVDFQAFLGSKVDAVDIDASEKYQGTASLKVTVPAPGDPSGTYAGGAFTARYGRDFSGYDALTFWAKASRNITLDVAGMGNDNTGTSKYTAQRNGIPLTTTWTRVVLPIPLPARLNDERGLFFFAEGAEGSQGSTVWFDEVRFEKTGVITKPRPAIVNKTVTGFVGGTVTVEGTRTTFAVSGIDIVMDHMPGYFTFASSDDQVVAVQGDVIRVVGSGTANITGKLGAIDATGALTVNVTPAPAEPAPTPTVPAADVISLFSNAYPNHTVDTWSATWDQADVTDLRIGNDDVKAYTNLVYAGIEFTSSVIDASAMTAFHIDVWSAQGSQFKVKLVDFGANGIYGGGDDREQELTFNASTTPAFVPGGWSGLDIPLASFTQLTTRAHVAQLIISSDSRIVYVDNLYFHR